MPTPVIPLYIRQRFWEGAGFNLKGVDLHASGNLRARFFNSSTPAYNIDTLQQIDDLTPATYEIPTTTGTPAYTNGTAGIIPASVTVAPDTVNDRVELDFADIVIGQDATGPINVQHMAICKYNVADTASDIIGMVDAGAAKSVQSGDLTMQLDPEGFCYW